MDRSFGRQLKSEPHITADLWIRQITPGSLNMECHGPWNISSWIQQAMNVDTPIIAQMFEFTRGLRSIRNILRLS